VFFPGGGGLTLTFPIKPGDECLVIFASRCIDAWWQQGGIKGQAELRMHDLSDGFIFAGVRSQPRAFVVNTTSAQLRTDDGAAYVEVNPTSKNINVVTPANANITAGGEAKVTAPTIKLVGNVEITGNLNISGTTIGNGVNLNTHVHTGVQPGGGNTGAPI
jgi:phage baseplate assembly protein gpV